MSQKALPLIDDHRLFRPFKKCIFPKLKLNKMYLPFGDRMKLQLHAAWNSLGLLGIATHAPPAIGWLVTERCNMKCVHCTSWLNRDKIDKKHILKIAERIAQSGTSMVMISGGEPLLVPNLKEVLLLFKEAGLKISINTNGLLLDQYADFILEHQIDALTVSFDGPDSQLHEHIRKAPGSFDKIVSNLRYLFDKRQNKRPYIGIRGVVLRNNYKELPAFFDAFGSISDDIKFQPVHEDHSFHAVVDHDIAFVPGDEATEKEMQEIINRLAQQYSYLNTPYFKSIPRYIFRKQEMKTTAIHHCMPHLLSALYIDPKGNAYICDQVVGKLPEEAVADIWTNPQRMEFLQQLARKGQCEHPCWLHSHSAKSATPGKILQKILA